MYMCTWRPELMLGVFLHGYAPFILRQSLSLNLKLLASLASQIALRSPQSLFSVLLDYRRASMTK